MENKFKGYVLEELLYQLRASRGNFSTAMDVVKTMTQISTMEFPAVSTEDYESFYKNK